MRAPLALLLLLCSCTVRTGLCESSADCPGSESCNLTTNRCEGEVDLAVTEEDLAAPEGDLAGADLATDLPDPAGRIEIELTGDGVGMVLQSVPPGINCPGTCSAQFAAETKVRLVPRADLDSYLVNWSGPCVGYGDCEVIVRGTVRVGAKVMQRRFQPTTSGVTSTLRAVFGLPPPATGAVFAVGEGGKALRWNGTAWINLNNPSTATIYGGWASAANDFWAVGSGAPLRWNGTTFTAASGIFVSPFWGVFGIAPNNIWAVDDGGYTTRYTNNWASEATEVFTPLRGVWGSAANNYWLVGHQGVIQRWDGVVWKLVPSTVTSHLYSIWGAGPSAIWAVGASGTILRWNGTTWAKEVSPVMASLRAVFGYSDGMGQASEVWAAGEGGVVLRRRAGSWAVVPSGSAITLYGVWGERPGELWTVGETGTILRYAAHR